MIKCYVCKETIEHDIHKGMVFLRFMPAQFEELILENHGKLTIDIFIGDVWNVTIAIFNFKNPFLSKMEKFTAKKTIKSKFSYFSDVILRYNMLI